MTVRVNTPYRRSTRATNNSHRKKAKKLIEYNHIVCPICGFDINISDSIEMAHLNPFWKTRDAGSHCVVATHKTCNQHLPDNETLDVSKFCRENLAIVKVNIK